jgi:hypothetical protein
MGNGQSVLDPDPVDDTYQLKFLGSCWLVAFYAVGMIWTTMGLLDRWIAKQRYEPMGLFDWALAVVLSSVWPVVLVVLMLLPDHNF